MRNSERHKQYMREYHKKRYQENKEKFKEINHQNYLKRKALGMEVGDQDIYHTIDELKQAEIEEFGAVGNAINWDKWTELVEQTKEDITNVLKDYKQPSKRKPIYVYTMTTKIPLIIFKDSDEAATALDINRIIITNHARTQVPIYYKNIILSYTPINETKD